MANPATLRYVRDVALPYATDHGIELHELRKVRRDGSVETLHGRLVQPGSRSLPIPVRTLDTGVLETSRSPLAGRLVRKLVVMRMRGLDGRSAVAP
jgi:hypothetical protein